MLGLEILGVVASAVQLAQVTLDIVTSLTGLFNQVLDAPKLIQSRLIQAQTLVEISSLIACMPQLQTAEVQTTLQSCSGNAEELRGVLKNFVVENDSSKIKKWMKAIGGVATEKRIATLLHSLEVGKSALVLYITRIDSTLLYDIDSRIELIRRELEELAQGVKTELPCIRLAIQSLAEKPAEIKVNPISDKAEACLLSLGAIDQNSFVSQTCKRSKNSGNWISRNAKYTSWFEPKDSRFLWVTAKAGHGKTTLASRIVQNIQIQQSSQKRALENYDAKPALLFFFFHKSNLEAEGTASGAFRTLIYQLVRQIPEVHPIVLERYELLSSRGSFEWSWENLSSMFGDLLKCIKLCIYLVLDAVNECESESQKALLDWLQELVDDTRSLTESNSSRSLLKILVISRPDGDIYDSLSHFPTIEIAVSDTSDDMKSLISTRIGDFARRRHLEIDLSQRIVQFLERNAHGIFLWVVLVIQELERRDDRLSDEVITAKLSSIPLTLVSTYEAILQQPLLARRKDMWRILRWLIYGRRGLALDELEVALCLETGISRWYDFAGDVNSLCGSLIRFNGPRGEITLIHQTARDFLDHFIKTARFEEVSRLDLTSIEANAHLAEICVQYLLKNEEFLLLPGLEHVRLQDYESTVGVTLSRHPFLSYAVEHWASHTRAVGTPDPKLARLIINLLESATRRGAIMQLIYYLNHQGSYSAPLYSQPIHLAAYFNLPWLVAFYISQDHDSVHSVCATNDTPVIWASEMGSIECVQILLEAGADPNQTETDGWSALHWTARNGHPEVAKLLLKYNARQENVCCHDKEQTPLNWARSTENWEVFHILEDWGKGNTTLISKES